MDLVLTKYRERALAAYFDSENNNKLVNVTALNDETGALVGDIYVGRIKNHVKNINAAFVEIAGGELCFLQFDDKDKMIPKNESDVVVQVTREGIKTKQAAVSTDINLTGKYLIKTQKNQISISSKIKNVKRRNELLVWMEELINNYTDNDSTNNGSAKECRSNHCSGNGTGYIIRTNAENVSKEELVREYDYLEKLYADILKKAEYSTTHSLLYRTSFAVSQVRDGYDRNIDRIVTDDESIYNEIRDYLNEVSPDMLCKLSLYEDDSFPLDAMYGLSFKLDKALSKKVWLDSGAYLIIEPTEALTVIDVNTGKAVKKKSDKEKHFLKINLEACEELFRQISVRNLSGIIIVDFIDMKSKENNVILMDKLKELASLDSVKTTVVDMTALGLVEITRKKVHKPLHELF